MLCLARSRKLLQLPFGRCGMIRPIMLLATRFIAAVNHAVIRVYDEAGNVRFTSRAMTVPSTPSKTSSPSGPAWRSGFLEC